MGCARRGYNPRRPHYSSRTCCRVSCSRSCAHAILQDVGFEFEETRNRIDLRFPPDSHYNSGAELVGIRELIAPGEADYIEIADRVRGNPTLRGQQSPAHTRSIPHLIQDRNAWVKGI